MTGECKILRIPLWTLFKQPAGCAYVGEKPDSGLRHGHHRFFCVDYQVRSGRKAQPPSHRDAICENNDRFLKSIEIEIQRIFLLKESLCALEGVLLRSGCQFLDI